jgi:hypothetical protein
MTKYVLIAGDAGELLGIRCGLVVASTQARSEIIVGA